MYHTHLSFIDYSHVSRVIREQWIRAKYERKEFLAEAADDDRTYTTGQVAVCVCVCGRGEGGGGVPTIYVLIIYSMQKKRGKGLVHFMNDFSVYLGGHSGGGVPNWKNYSSLLQC